MMIAGMRLKLSKLLGEAVGEDPAEPYPQLAFSARVERLLRDHGCQHRSETVDTESGFQGWVLRYALRMLEITYRRLEQPGPTPPPELLARFQEVLPGPPEEFTEFFQGRIDAASSCRRAVEVQRLLGGQGPVLCLGDDDGTSVALALLGVEKVAVLDIDVRVLEWLRASGLPIELERGDVREMPASHRSRFAAVVTDPVRDGPAGAAFLRAAGRCLRRGGWLFWADHPDWNPGYPVLERWTHRLHLEPIRVLKDWHAYRAAYLDDSTAEHFGLDPDWLRRLAADVRIWSHLHVLKKA
ncbi:MAG: bis-aminopropyl spermidine synthase family protein [Armatimonadetes bacterium]|nr:bis-aminopropyl spermidine synthase family protein [Armatimonadota bacterium]